jgi:transposase
MIKEVKMKKIETWEELEARRAEEKRRFEEHEQFLREDARRKQEYADSRPPLSEWTLEEIFDGYSPYDSHHYTTEELNAELARRFGIEVEDGQDVRDVLLKRGLIDRTTWEIITDYWDSGMAY